MSGMLIFVLVLIAALIVTLYMVYKNGGSSPAPAPAPAPSSGGGPSIDVQGIERTLNPDKKEGYAIREYSTGTDAYDLNKLSENVSMTLQWKNKGGFENVEKIIAQWHHNTSSIPMRKEFTKNNENNNNTVTKYFTNFTDNTVTLTADGNFSAVGTNIIRLYYVLEGTTDEVELTPPVGTDFQEWTITIPDLSGTIGMVEPTTYTWTPSKGSMEIEKDLYTKEYQMWPVGAHYNTVSKIKDQYGSENTSHNNATVSMVPVDGANNKVKFILYESNGVKVLGYVYTDSNNKWLKNGWDAGSNSDQTPSIFEIIAGSKPDHYRFKQNIGGEDHFLILVTKGVTSHSDHRFRMMKIDDMGDSCTYNSMDIFMAPMSDTDRKVIETDFNDRRYESTQC
tara:strand:+ start:1678 stop:2859 length:1182 start_codon:yes stop_codon:yes gene_type:complete